MVAAMSTVVEMVWPVTDVMVTVEEMIQLIQVEIDIAYKTRCRR